ncbi:hypothetical protein ACWCRC_42530, partial [Streptomyces sp. NPDC001940]
MVWDRLFGGPRPVGLHPFRAQAEDAFDLGVEPSLDRHLDGAPEVV